MVCEKDNLMAQQPFTQEVYDELMDGVVAGRVMHWDGRSARTKEDVNFIADVYAPKPPPVEETAEPVSVSRIVRTEGAPVASTRTIVDAEKGEQGDNADSVAAEAAAKADAEAATAMGQTPPGPNGAAVNPASVAATGSRAK